MFFRAFILTVVALTSVSLFASEYLFHKRKHHIAEEPACGTPITGSLFSESFDGGRDLVWTQNLGSGGTINDLENTTPDACGFIMDWREHALSAGSSGFSYAYHDYGSAVEEVYLRGFVYVDSESLDDGDIQTLFWSTSSSNCNTNRNGIHIDQNSGNLRLRYYSGYAYVDSVNISLNTAYCVEWYRNNTTNAWDWRVTEEVGGTYGPPSSEGSGTHSGINNGRYFCTGMRITSNPNNPWTFQIDNIDASTTGWLGCDDG